MDKKQRIANCIIRILKEKDLSKREFSTLMNVQPSVITKWLSGKHNFTIYTITEIERILSTQILYIIL